MTINAPGVERSRSDRFLGELLWLAPTVAASFFLIIVVYKNARSQELIAATGVFLAAVAIIVAWLIYRLQMMGPPTRNLRETIDRRWHYLSYFMSIVMIGIAVFGVPKGSDDNPDIYLAKDETVIIGVNGKLPGWSSRSFGDPEGFDVELAEFLRREYKFKIKWKYLTQLQREHQWDGGSEGPPADLVISTFSITPLRLENFDMAGPYYFDVTLAWRNLNKPEIGLEDDKSHACAVRGTTGAQAINNLIKERDQINSGRFVPHLKDRLEDCINPFFDPRSKINYIGSDWSIVRAFKPGIPVVAAQGDSEVSDPQEPRSENKERYGIAFPNNHPNLCRSLSAAINKFLTEESLNGSWDEAFNSTLGVHDIVKSWHNPQRSDPSYCGR